MKQKTYKTEDIKKEDNVIYHKSSYEATMEQKPYIIPATPSTSYSKLEKAQRHEEKKLIKELKDYTKY